MDVLVNSYQKVNPLIPSKTKDQLITRQDLFSRFPTSPHPSPRPAQKREYLIQKHIIYWPKRLVLFIETEDGFILRYIFFYIQFDMFFHRLKLMLG